MQKALGVSSSAEVAKKMCSEKDKEGFIGATRDKLHQCLKEEMQRMPPPTAAEKEKRQKMHDMEPEKRDAMMKAKVTKVLQCKLAALS